MTSGFFALLDDIAMLMDDVVVMSKITAKKTVALLGDDLAVNAEKASGFTSSRELPVLWKISKGAFLNKLIILPFAFLLSAFLPETIIPILLFGGIYLAYEGAEKIYEYMFPKHHAKKKEERRALSGEELLRYEKQKIKAAIFVDFILSIEIIVVSLSIVANESLYIQIPVVTIVAIVATIGVYGVVALIVRMDDFGYKLIEINNNRNKLLNLIGESLVKAMPLVIRALGVIGTIAMLLVAGGIYIHNIDLLHHLGTYPFMLGEFSVGLLIGAIAFALVSIFKMIRDNIKSSKN